MVATQDNHVWHATSQNSISWKNKKLLSFLVYQPQNRYQPENVIDYSQSWTDCQQRCPTLAIILTVQSAPAPISIDTLETGLHKWSGLWWWHIFHLITPGNSFNLSCLVRHGSHVLCAASRWEISNPITVPNIFDIERSISLNVKVHQILN